jgi:hypothetical protein
MEQNGREHRTREKTKRLWCHVHGTVEEEQGRGKRKHAVSGGVAWKKRE